jgi:hypothetical protein
LPTQVSHPTFAAALLTGALSAALISLVVTHGLLRTFMHARGIAPWTWKDTIGSSLLIGLGGALLGAASMLVCLIAIGTAVLTPAYVSVTALLLLLGAIVLRLGLLALRKLT